MDWLAKRLSRFSGVVFSLPAVLAWMTLILVTMVSLVTRLDEVVASLRSLPGFLYQAGPLLTVTVFVSSKLMHEIAHAVMCRRVGSRCGSFGILLLCGVPCPYCDVTDIWRQPSTINRIAVMLAGIFVELVVAALAFLVWCVSLDPAIRLAALNVVVVCGISTVVFNANPLMRYDGYFVLGDLIGSTNLRHEARQSFAALVTSRIAGESYGVSQRSDRRTVFLSGYHVAATIYRLVVFLAIAALFVQVADLAGVKSLAMLLIGVFAVIAAVSFVKRIRSILHGAGRWEQVPRIRRSFVVSMIAILVLAVLFTPLPIHRRASGVIDAAFATNVYFSSDGIIDVVYADFGERVEQGQSLVALSNDDLTVHHAHLSGNWEVARLRNDLARRVTLAGSRHREPYQSRLDTSAQWPALQAAEDAARDRLESSRKRVAECKVFASQSGILIPPAPASDDWPVPNQTRQPTSLRDLVGDAVDVHSPWCRISSDATLHAIFVIDARDRERIDVGSPVKFTMVRSPDDVIATKVLSVSEIRSDDRGLMRKAAFQVVCRLPLRERDRLISLLGARCHGVFPLKKRTLASLLADQLVDWVRG